MIISVNYNTLLSIDPNFFTAYFKENMPSQEAICITEEEKGTIFTTTYKGF